jgi:hypothetical protein
MTARISLAALLVLAAGCAASAATADYDFFYLVLQVSCPPPCRA